MVIAECQLIEKKQQFLIRAAVEAAKPLPSKGPESFKTVERNFSMHTFGDRRRQPAQTQYQGVVVAERSGENDRSLFDQLRLLAQHRVGADLAGNTDANFAVAL